MRGLGGQEGGEEVAVVGYAGEGVWGGEEQVRGLVAGFYLIPGDGGGDGGELAGAQRGGGGGGLGGGVLAPVDGDLAGGARPGPPGHPGAGGRGLPPVRACPAPGCA